MLLWRTCQDIFPEASPIQIAHLNEVGQPRAHTWPTAFWPSFPRLVVELFGGGEGEGEGFENFQEALGGVAVAVEVLALGDFLAEGFIGEGVMDGVFDASLAGGPWNVEHV